MTNTYEQDDIVSIEVLKYYDHTTKSLSVCLNPKYTAVLMKDGTLWYSNLPRKQQFEDKTYEQDDILYINSMIANDIKYTVAEMKDFTTWHSDLSYDQNAERNLKTRIFRQWLLT